MNRFQLALLIAVAFSLPQSAQAGKGGGHAGGGHSGGGHAGGGGHSAPHMSAPHVSQPHHSSAPHVSQPHNSPPKSQHASAPHQNASNSASHAARGTMSPQFSQPGHHRGSANSSNSSNAASHRPSQVLNAGNLAYHAPTSSSKSQTTGTYGNSHDSAASTAAASAVTAGALALNRPSRLAASAVSPATRTATSITATPTTTPTSTTATTTPTTPSSASVLPYSHAGTFLNAYGNTGYGYNNYGRHHYSNNYGRGYGRRYYGNNNSNYFGMMRALNRLITALNQLRPGMNTNPGMAYGVRNALMGVVHGYSRPPSQPVYQLATHLTSVLPTRTTPYINTAHLARELMTVMNAGNGNGNGMSPMYAARNAASLIRSSGVGQQGAQMILNDLQMIASWHNGGGNGMGMGINGLAGIR